MNYAIVIASVSLAIWLYLLAFRGGFWRAHIRDDRDIPAEPMSWPQIAVVIPARNEADVIGDSLGSLFKETYPQPFPIILVDDQSDDGTAKTAAAIAERYAGGDRLVIIRGADLAPGWTGKLWSVKQGVDRALSLPAKPRYLLLTDADIAYDPGTIKRLVARAEACNLVLTSLMVRLRCVSLAERLLIPAFVFFFQMLYPFAWVNRRENPMAAAAGGCMLVRTDTFLAAGGVEAIRGSLIDDCALGRVMKEQGPIWLGLTANAHSLRQYPAFSDIRRMVARSAYDQLNYSPVLLAGTIFGMAITYLAPPSLAIFASGEAQILGAVVWGLMTLALIPILRLYKLSPVWSIALPLTAALYTVFTIDSAYQHWRGRGGFWKGRVQARKAEAR